MFLRRSGRYGQQESIQKLRQIKATVVTQRIWRKFSGLCPWQNLPRYLRPKSRHICDPLPGAINVSAKVKKRSEYLELRRPYEPQSFIRLVIIAESPPVSGKYFYDPTGATSEPLFAALMKQIGSSPSTKKEGLREFQRRGWILVDATYQPVNKGLPDSSRDKVIERDYPLLHGDLARLTPDRSAPLVLVKANICRILQPKLVQDGFNVLNRDSAIPFPSTGQQNKFHEQFGAILRAA